jgi:ATP-binding cassette subfamily F protein uup
LSDARAVFDVVADGLGELSALVSAYHHAAAELAAHGGHERLERLGRLQHELEDRDGWRLEQRVELVLARLELPADVVVDTLSGGWRRRVLLARALVSQPDLLLLDEPTNHLDIEAITWLESFLADYPGAVVFVTHDRAFLQRLATRVVELDRGQLTSWPGDYGTFVRKKEEWLSNEALAQEKFDKRLAEEEVWLRRGIKARRTRDEGRVKALLEMREVRAARRAVAGTVRLGIEQADTTGKLVFEARGVTKAFGDRVVVRDFSTRILRGDRIGLIGPNGAGKTTLLRVLLGESAPDAGDVRRGANVQVAYYDQQREQLDPERTVFETIGGGSDNIVVNGRARHVNAYLSDFLFPPERARSPVKSLSGGERNRLLLARLFTRPSNVLVLDEPTNDLDIETLELLEAQLTEWPGTLLLVSHDRVFLDNIVTSTFAFEGDGIVREYVGGYEDWLRQRRVTTPPAAEKMAGAKHAADEAPPTQAPGVAPAAARKLSYNEQRELERLPALIDALEEEQRLLSARVSAPEFYREPSPEIAAALARLEALQQELTTAYARWDELDSRT